MTNNLVYPHSLENILFFLHRNVIYYFPIEIDNSVELYGLENDSASEGKLIIYAYDIKLSEYITYNIIIKPQTYQSNYSTVNNGFGCFGSMNLLEKTLTF